MKQNCFKYFFLFFLIISENSCNSLPISDLNPNKFAEIFTGTFYQKYQIRNSYGFFENKSSHHKILEISRVNLGNFLVKEIDISFYVYSNKFLKKINILFPEKAPSKYRIYEKIRIGTGKQTENSTIEITFSKFSIRESHSSKLQDTIVKFSENKAEEKNLNIEKLFFSANSEEELWKSEEIISLNKQEQLHWKHYPSSGTIQNYPYSEFSPNKISLETSRIFNLEDYSFQKVKKDLHSETKLYYNKEYIIYYSPKEKLDPENSEFINLTENTEDIRFMKMNFPLIIFKKDEKNK